MALRTQGLSTHQSNCYEVISKVDQNSASESRRGEESAMDGVVGGPRVGKERQLPYNVLKIVPIKYMISYFVFSIP